MRCSRSRRLTTVADGEENADALVQAVERISLLRESLAEASLHRASTVAARAAQGNRSSRARVSNARDTSIAEGVQMEMTGAAAEGRRSRCHERRIQRASLIDSAGQHVASRSDDPAHSEPHYPAR